MLIGLFAAGVQAQNTSPYWSLAGNNNASSSAKLGTTNADPLRLTTNNLTRMYVSDNGNVGIGTTNPQQRFHVEASGLINVFVNTNAPGSISGSGMIGYVKGLPTAAGQRLGYFLLGSRGGAENNYHSVGMAGYASSGWTAGSSYPGYLTFETTPAGSTSRSERVRIGSNGNVGIGVTDAAYLLDIGGRIRLRSQPGSVTAGLWLNNTDNSGLTGFIGGYNDNTMGLYGAGYGWSLFMNTDNGHIGIGDNNPFNKLVVADNTTSTPTAIIKNLYTAGSYTDGLYIYAGRDGGVSSTVSYYTAFVTPGGSTIGYISQATANSVAYNTTSDKRLKTNIRETKFGLADVNKIQVRDFNFIGSKTEQTGFLAQQLYEVFPEAVSKGGDDAKTRPWMVDYGRVTPLLVKGMQELSKENEQLKQELAELRQMVLDLKNGRVNTVNTSSAFLETAMPNPARTATTIRYSVPESTTSARLTLVNAKGQVMKELSLNNSGTGQVNLSTANLPAGVYTYTLMINGQQAASKQLVIAR